MSEGERGRHGGHSADSGGITGDGDHSDDQVHPVGGSEWLLQQLSGGRLKSIFDQGATGAQPRLDENDTETDAGEPAPGAASPESEAASAPAEPAPAAPEQAGPAAGDAVTDAGDAVTDADADPRSHAAPDPSAWWATPVPGADADSTEAGDPVEPNDGQGDGEPAEDAPAESSLIAFTPEAFAPTVTPPSEPVRAFEADQASEALPEQAPRPGPATAPDAPVTPAAPDAAPSDPATGPAVGAADSAVPLAGAEGAERPGVFSWPASDSPWEAAPTWADDRPPAAEPADDDEDEFDRLTTGDWTGPSTAAPVTSGGFGSGFSWHLDPSDDLDPLVDHPEPDAGSGSGSSDDAHADDSADADSADADDAHADDAEADSAGGVGPFAPAAAGGPVIDLGQLSAEPVAEASAAGSAAIEADAIPPLDPVDGGTASDDAESVVVGDPSGLHHEEPAEGAAPEAVPVIFEQRFGHEPEFDDVVQAEVVDPAPGAGTETRPDAADSDGRVADRPGMDARGTDARGTDATFDVFGSLGFGAAAAGAAGAAAAGGPDLRGEAARRAATNYGSAGAPADDDPAPAPSDLDAEVSAFEVSAAEDSAEDSDAENSDDELVLDAQDVTDADDSDDDAIDDAVDDDATGFAPLSSRPSARSAARPGDAAGDADPADTALLPGGRLAGPAAAAAAALDARGARDARRAAPDPVTGDAQEATGARGASRASVPDGYSSASALSHVNHSSPTTSRRSTAVSPSGTPAAARRRRRTLLGVGIGLVAVLVLVGLFFLGTRLVGAPVASPTESSAPSAPAETSEAPAATPEPVLPTVGPLPAGTYAWNQLLGGECLSPFESQWAEEYTVVDCAAEHPAQLVRVGVVSGDAAAAYPGGEALVAEVNALCQADGVVDLAAAAVFGDVQLRGSFPATEEQWAGGDRTYYCFVSRAGGAPLTGSLIPVAPAA